MSDLALRTRIESDLMEKVAALRADGPGDVRVGRVSDISAVRVMRECRVILDADEIAWLGEMVELVKREAFGIQVTGLSRITQEAQAYRPDIDASDPADNVVRRIGSVFMAVVGVFNVGRLLKMLFPPKEVARSGSPLPAPENLVLAAEAWAIAALCEGRLDVSLGPLREPWERASVET